MIMTEQGAISLHGDIGQTQLPNAGGELRGGNDLTLQVLRSATAKKHRYTCFQEPLDLRGQRVVQHLSVRYDQCTVHLSVDNQLAIFDVGDLQGFLTDDIVA